MTCFCAATAVAATPRVRRGPILLDARCWYTHDCDASQRGAVADVPNGEYHRIARFVDATPRQRDEHRPDRTHQLALLKLQLSTGDVARLSRFAITEVPENRSYD